MRVRNESGFREANSVPSYSPAALTTVHKRKALNTINWNQRLLESPAHPLSWEALSLHPCLPERHHQQ